MSTFERLLRAYGRANGYRVIAVYSDRGAWMGYLEGHERERKSDVLSTREAAVAWCVRDAGEVDRA